MRWSGTIGEAPEHVTLVEKASDVDLLDLDGLRSVAYLTQTTLSVDETSQIIDRLKVKYPDIVGPPKDDICYATQSRQLAIRQLASEADIVIVVGSQNSSNSRRLREVAEASCLARLVDDANQLKEEWFTGNETVGVTAGASAPEISVQSVVTWLQCRYETEVREHGVDERHRSFPLPDEAIQLQLPTT